MKDQIKISDSTIDQTVENMEEYFVSKVINHEYIVKHISKYRIKIIINDKYQFDIWIANGAGGLSFTNTEIGSFMALKRNLSVKEQNIIYNRHLSDIEKANDEILQAKRRQLEELKKELGEI